MTYVKRLNKKEKEDELSITTIVISSSYTTLSFVSVTATIIYSGYKYESVVICSLSLPLCIQVITCDQFC